MFARAPKSNVAKFQSTLPQGERLVVFIPTFDNSISIHAPTRGATRLISEGHSGYIYFNPRSHKGSDRIRRDLAVGKKISIHAPTRGATHGGGQGCWAEAISIHAPTRGATETEVVSPLSTIFQSTLPQGERRQRARSPPGPWKISIHAPTRGATYLAVLKGWITLISIHAPTRGATFHSV